jgi:hypothetical protein
VLVAAACVACYEGPGDQGDAGGSTSVADTDDSGAPTTAGNTTGPTDCVAGQQNCVCLDNACVGTLHCVENECLPGPEIELDGEMAALAGVRLPVDFDVNADTFSWSQISGPGLDLGEAVASPLLIDIPASAAGEAIVLRLTTVRNTVEDFREITISIVDASVQQAFVNDGGDDEEPPPPPTFGSTDGIEFYGGNAWVASSADGMLHQVSPDGQILNSYDVGGTPTSVRRGSIPGENNDIDVLYFTDSTNESVRAFIFGNQQTQTITDADADALPLGPVAYVTTGDGGDLVFSNAAGGQVFYYDAFSGTTFQVVDSTEIGPSPHALEFGPGGYLYVGTVGRVWKVPILGNDIDPDDDEIIEVGPAEPYLDVGADTDPSLEIDGLVFDGTLNLFAGASGASRLFLARYVVEGEATLSNSWDRSSNAMGKFVGLRHGDNNFSNRALYFASRDSGAIAGVFTGVPRNL